jgi:rhamnulokinase
MPINTLVQLFAAIAAGERSLEIARRSFIPDLLHYWLSGVATSEHTNATTTQCLDPRAQARATDLLERLRIPAGVFPEIVRPATILEVPPPEEVARHVCAVRSFARRRTTPHQR